MDERRLYSLDAARGIAALVVVVWHWQHLYWMDGGREIVRSEQPFYWLLRPFYEGGLVGVDFFFVLSGFVFYWLYSEKVRSGSTGALRFTVLRLSRLYPLHLLTLLLVAVMQALREVNFVYREPSLSDFIAQLFLVQSWGDLESGLTFNGPAWTISIEALLYGIFWVVCHLRFGASVAGASAMIAVGLLISMTVSPLGRYVAEFFSGGVAYFIWSAVMRSRTQRRDATWIIVGTLIGWAILGPVLAMDGEQMPFFARFTLFPLTVLSLAVAESILGVRFGGLRWLGEISYSSYLLHFPLQLALANLVLWGVATDAAVQGQTSFILFFAVLTGVSLASYKWLEKPSRDFVRRTILAPTRSTEAPDPVAPHA